MFEYLGLVLLGFAGGIIGSMIGLGGGFVIVPILTFFGFSHQLAASNSLFAAFSNAVASTASYAKQGRIQYSIGLRLGLLSIPGTILGAYISDEITPSLFKILFGLIILSSSLYIFLKRKMETRNHNFSKQIMILMIGASFFAGIISSLFGIGGGVVFVPLMVIAIGLSMKIAAPTSQLVLIFASFSGLIAHSILGHPDFYQSLFLSIGAFIGGLVGSRLSIQIEEKKLRIIIVIVLIITAIKLFVDSATAPF